MILSFLLVWCFLCGGFVGDADCVVLMVAELQQIVSTPCDSEDLIDNVLRGYLGLTVKYKGLFSFIYSFFHSFCVDGWWTDLTTS